ncbi:Gfo/Idh/MocA family protein [Neorhodopirellula pilleata]|uniref:Inositol 2-dehydrogenase n=1 Tax=Neorhodopirellula pilleata TaxID=2714738 RepID=A0A5C6AV56_9BACT|nr:Gfo/Idh/MocA family oxidoreductase [Neorhodopirellula pilleata]TWU03367.1 Inositol 2-dehydrogenase [Neorhodopirellula pilleata]
MRSNQRDRRQFLRSSAILASVGLVTRYADADEKVATEVSPLEKIRIGIMGVNGRGGAIARGMMATGQTEIAYVCDVDERAVARAAEAVSKTQNGAPEIVADFRRILDDQRVDVLVCAAPNHWHAPATILGCAAGKHVYVEKPCSHTPGEGEMAVAAARAANRIVQMGSQRRSWPGIIEAIGKIHGGEIGDVLYSRTWYNNRRSSIGHGKTTEVPTWLDWRMWQGPAPDRPFRDNIVHYNWHWHWHWGNGELGNNGIHAIDVARWGLEVTYPVRVTAGGGKYRHDDDQETPDTMMLTLDFPEGKTITWEGLSWSPLGPHDSRFGISFHGTDGSIVIRGGDYVQFDNQDKQIATGNGASGDAEHFNDFLDAVRTGRLPNADIETAHQSTLLCHLGNIAYRTQSVLNTNPADGHVIQNAAAEAMWNREYAPGWEPKV